MLAKRQLTNDINMFIMAMVIRYEKLYNKQLFEYVEASFRDKNKRSFTIEKIVFADLWKHNSFVFNLKLKRHNRI